MGFFDKTKEIETIQYYIDKYSGVKEDMAKLENKIDQNTTQIKWVIIFNTILLALLSIYIPITINLQSEKFDAKFESVSNQQQIIFKQLEDLKQDVKALKIKLK